MKRRRQLDIEDRAQDLADLLRGEPAAALELLRIYELSWIHHENALEGVVFTGQEIETALENKPVAEASTMNAYRDVRNMKAAIDVVRAEASVPGAKPTLALVKKLYETIHAGIESRARADFRREIPLHRAYFHDIAVPAKIPAMLEKLLASCDEPGWKSAPSIQKASKLQHAFMHIYPFTEGSGKIARLLSNLVLLADGYQPCIIHTIDRNRYYESLKQLETALRALMMESMENALANAEKFIQQAVAARSKHAAD